MRVKEQTTYSRVKQFLEEMIFRDPEIQKALDMNDTTITVQDALELSGRVGEYTYLAIMQVLKEDENALKEIMNESLVLIVGFMHDQMFEIVKTVQMREDRKNGLYFEIKKPDYPVDMVKSLKAELTQLVEGNSEQWDTIIALDEAWKIVKKYTGKDNLSEEEEYLFADAMDYIVNKSSNDVDIAAYNFGSYYMGIERYDCALKYFKMGANLCSGMSCAEIGKIYYYGLTGEVDYEKAYLYLKLADDMHWKNDSYLIADMYRYGQYLEKDYNKYDDMISDLFDLVEEDTNSFHSIPEVFFREAEIILKDEQSEAIKAGKAMLFHAEEVLKDRITCKKDKRTQLRDVKTLRDIQDLLYVEVIGEVLVKDIFDLDLVGRYEIADIMVMEYKGNHYNIMVEKEEDGNYSICFLEKWYRDMRDFIDYAILDGHVIRALFNELKVVKLI